jgi:hypothetical protein
MKSTNSANRILLTGTSTGIGRAATLTLAENGYRVLAAVRKQEDIGTDAKLSAFLKRNPPDRWMDAIIFWIFWSAAAGKAPGRCVGSSNHNGFRIPLVKLLHSSVEEASHPFEMLRVTF